MTKIINSASKEDHSKDTKEKSKIKLKRKLLAAKWSYFVQHQDANYKDRQDASIPYLEYDSAQNK